MISFVDTTLRCPSAGDDYALDQGREDGGGRTLTILPLQRGYYVANDTPCAKASNATLLLLHRHGVSGARDFCEFKQIDQTGPEIYQVHEVCTDFQGSDPQSRTVHYRIVGNTRFVVSDNNGVVLDARHCLQTDLPAAWRDTDIRAEIE